jgi:AP-2 complex subunit alpha
MLGYEIDFGHMEAIKLLKSYKFSEKQMARTPPPHFSVLIQQQGYLAISLLLHEEHSLIPLLIQSLSDDLGARSEYTQCLALSVIANIGGKQMAEAQIAPTVIKLLLAKYVVARITHTITPPQYITGPLPTP